MNDLMTNQAALVIVDRGQSVAIEGKALTAFLSCYPGARLVSVGLTGSGPPTHPAIARIVNLPLDATQVDIAAAIGLQICLNEGCSLVGLVEHLTAAELERASACFQVLQDRTADVVLLDGDNIGDQRIFLSAHAAFTASFWGALRGELRGYRLDILASMAKLASRKALRLDAGAAAPGFREFDGVDIGRFLMLALQLRSKLGIEIGKLPRPSSPRVKKIAVITPYYKEPDSELLRCMESVRTQTHACDHIMVSDGHPNPLAINAGVCHIELGKGHADNGNTPRYVGGLVALANGYDAVAYLDADNWYHTKHIEKMVLTQHDALATAVCSQRNIYLADGFKLTDPDYEDRKRRHVDTSCLLITHHCEYVAHLWGQMPQAWGPVCDRVTYSALSGQAIAWTNSRTLNFKSNYRFHYQSAGRPVPEKVHDIPLKIWRSFVSQDPEFQKLSISRTGRIISIHLPQSLLDAIAKAQSA